MRSHGERLITMKRVNIWGELDLSAEYKYVTMSADKLEEIAFSSTVGHKFQALFKKLFNHLTNPNFTSELMSMWVHFKGFRGHEEKDFQI